VDGQRHLYPGAAYAVFTALAPEPGGAGHTLNQQLLDEERDQLLSEVQERMTLSGQLEPVLVENDNAAGRLWDMSAGSSTRRLSADRALRRFSNQQPELMQLAEQLGRSREAKSVPKDAPMETFRSLVREPATVPEQVDGLQQSDDILRLLPPELAHARHHRAGV
jgi:uncharacterized protein with von Willebrand factor type A (vWA) domain